MSMSDARADGVAAAVRWPYEVPLFTGILLFCFMLRVAAVWFAHNVNHTDEIFQYQEPAHRAVFGYGLVSWEFQEGLRSWLLPGLIAGIMGTVAIFTDSATAYLHAIGLTMSALSMVVVVVAWYWGRRWYGTPGAVITSVVAGSWVELVYFAPKPLSDTLSTYFLVVALFLVYPDTAQRARRSFFWSGFWLGTAFAFRFVLTPILAVVAVWVCRGALRERWLPMVLGGAGPVLAAGLLDALTWHYPFQSVWMNFWETTIRGVASAQGVEPWYWYIGLIVLNWSGAVAVMALTVSIGARRAILPALVALTTLCIFSLIGHKAYRFLFPALPVLLILAGLGTSEICVRVGAVYPGRLPMLTAAAVLGWLSTSAALAIGSQYRTMLTKDGALLEAFEQIGQRTDLCGLAVVDVPWWRTGGYTHLHRNVPLYSLPANEIVARASSFNFLLTEPRLADTPLGFTRESCHSNAEFNPGVGGAEICIYHRSGTCAPSMERLTQDRM